MEELLPCACTLLLGLLPAPWDCACGSWLDAQPKFPPENQTVRIPWFLSCHLLDAAFREDSIASKSIMDHHGQQRHWKCVDHLLERREDSNLQHWLGVAPETQNIQICFSGDAYGCYLGNTETVCFCILMKMFIHCNLITTAKLADLEMAFFPKHHCIAIKKVVW